MHLQHHLAFQFQLLANADDLESKNFPKMLKIFNIIGAQIKLEITNGIIDLNLTQATGR